METHKNTEKQTGSVVWLLVAGVFLASVSLFPSLYQVVGSARAVGLGLLVLLLIRDLAAAFCGSPEALRGCFLSAAVLMVDVWYCIWAGRSGAPSDVILDSMTGAVLLALPTVLKSDPLP